MQETYQVSAAYGPSYLGPKSHQQMRKREEGGTAEERSSARRLGQRSSPRGARGTAALCLLKVPRIAETYGKIFEGEKGLLGLLCYPHR